MGKSASKNVTGMATQRLRGSSMPIYEFKCIQCQNTVEQFFTIYADPVITCGNCQLPMQKQFAPTPTIFKGDGWAGKK